jgi:hypothetical protein
MSLCVDPALREGLVALVPWKTKSWSGHLPRGGWRSWEELRGDQRSWEELERAGESKEEPGRAGKSWEELG